jgi:hypothetical protein
LLVQKSCAVVRVAKTAREKVGMCILIKNGRDRARSIFVARLHRCFVIHDAFCIRVNCELMGSA